MSVEAVVFDWGGTLTPLHSVDLEDMWRTTAAALAPDRVDDVAKALHTVERQWWEEAVAGHRSGTTADLLVEAAAATGLDVPTAVHDLALDAHRETWTPHTVAKPEAASVLRELRTRELLTGLLSNTHWPRAWHEGFLERDGLLDLIDVRVYTSDIAHLKPSPEAFAAVLDELGVPANNAAFVGDRRYDDVFGAARVGMRTIWMSNSVTPDYDAKPDAVVEQLADVVDVIDSWRALPG